MQAKQEKSEKSRPRPAGFPGRPVDGFFHSRLIVLVYAWFVHDSLLVLVIAQAFDCTATIQHLDIGNYEQKHGRPYPIYAADSSLFELDKAVRLRFEWIFNPTCSFSALGIEKM